MSISNMPTDPALRAAYDAGRESRQGQVDVMGQQMSDLYEMQKSLTDEIRTLREAVINQLKWERFCERITDCFEDVDGAVRLKSGKRDRYQSVVRHLVLEVRRVRRERGDETDEEIRARGEDPETYRQAFLEAHRTGMDTQAVSEFQLRSE